jgi:hypothetical protein
VPCGHLLDALRGPICESGLCTSLIVPYAIDGLTAETGGRRNLADPSRKVEHVAHCIVCTVRASKREFNGINPEAPYLGGRRLDERQRVQGVVVSA